MHEHAVRTAAVRAAGALAKRVCCVAATSMTLWFDGALVGAWSADVPSPAPLHDSQRVCAVRFPVRPCNPYSSAHVGDLQPWESHCAG